MSVNTQSHNAHTLTLTPTQEGGGDGDDDEDIWYDAEEDLESLESTMESVASDMDGSPGSLKETVMVACQEYWDVNNVDHDATNYASSQQVIKNNIISNTLTDTNNYNNNNILQVLNINVCGLNAKMDDLVTLLEDADRDNILMATTEIFEPKGNPTIEGLDFIQKTRPKGTRARRGGVGLFLTNKWSYKEIKELTVMKEGFPLESLGVYIQDLDLVTVILYRPIGSQYVTSDNPLDTFFTTMEDQLDYINRNYPKSNVLYIGDFNIDLMKTDDEKTVRLQQTMASAGLQNKIHLPTRIQNNSKTLIDHTWTNINNTIISHVLVDNISDHYMTHVQLKTDIQQKEEEEKPQRVINSKTCKKIKEQIRETDWSLIHDENLTINEKWKQFEEKLTEIIITQAPLKKQKAKKKHKSWFTNKLKNKRNKVTTWLTRMKLNPQQLCQNGNTTQQNYLKHRNEYKKMVQKEKLEYWKEEFTNAKDSKATWGLINKAVNRTQQMKGIEELKKEDGTVTTDEKEMANILNSFFSEVGRKTADKIPHTDRDPLEHLTEEKMNYRPELPALRKPFQEDIEEIVKNMKPKNNKMSNNINMKIIKECIEPLAPLITKLIQESIDNCTFPQHLKSAEVCALYKSKGCNKECTNYRPISLLDPFSKIFEKTMEQSIRQHMETWHLITDSQHGFRGGHSTDSMVIPLLEELSSIIEEDLAAVLIMMDCSKAFDSISRPLLLKKMERYGFTDNSLKLLDSYLSDRHQQVRINDTYSDRLPCDTGVPQGSILGPILYGCYTNDVAQSIIDWAALFADDSNSLHKDKKLQRAKQLAQEALFRVQEWFRSNKVTVNATKSKYIIIGEKPEEYKMEDIYIEGKPLTRVHSEKKGEASTSFVGVELDEKLNFASHINKIGARASRNLAALGMVRNTLPKKIKLQIYYSLIQSHLTLNIIAFGRSAKKHLRKLQVIQNKALRIVENLGPRESTEATRKKYKIMTIEQNYRYVCCLWGAKVVGKTAPTAVRSIMERCNNWDRNMTFKVKKYKSSRAKNLSASEAIATNWNSLSLETRRSIRVALTQQELPPEYWGVIGKDRMNFVKRTLKEEIMWN